MTTRSTLPPMYYERSSRAVLNVAPAPDLGEPRAHLITRVNVPVGFTGEGHGERLLTEVCRDADQLGVPLYLTPVPGRHGVDAHRLVRWYRRHGFEWYPDAAKSRLYMRRPPCPPPS